MRPSTLGFVVALCCAAWPLKAGASGPSDWQRFRRDYPYHVQAIALGPPEPDGRTLVVAEPPPSVTLAALRQAWPRAFGAAVIEHHGIGVDGWVADIVTRLPPQSDEETKALVQHTAPRPAGRSPNQLAS